MTFIDKSLRTIKKVAYSPFLVAIIIICFLFLYKYFYTNSLSSAIKRSKRKYLLRQDKIDQVTLSGDTSQNAYWQCLKPLVSVYSIQGHRLHMEDRYDLIDPGAVGVQLYSVYDGHGGGFASSFAEEMLFKMLQVRIGEENRSRNKLDLGRILTEEILSLDKFLLELQSDRMDMSGSTVLVAALHSDLLTVANVGDSRAVLCTDSNNAVTLTSDHKPENKLEKKRIEENGGFISFSGVWRVGGILATSRAIGDYSLKKENMLIADPDITYYNLKKGCKFIILATDGLWDVFTDKEAVDFICKLHEKRSRLLSKEGANEKSDDNPDHGAKDLTIEAFRRGSMDNITVLIIMIEKE